MVESRPGDILGSESEYWWILGESKMKTATILFEAEQNSGCMNACHAALERALKAHIATTGDLRREDMAHDLTYLAK